MAKKFPKPQSLTLCEDIRKEEGGKLSLLGVLGSGLTVMSGSEDGHFFPQLCVFGQFRGDDAEFQAYVEVLDPHGESLLKTEKKAISIRGNNLVLTLKIKNLVLTTSGSYQFNVHFDTKKISLDFEINLKDNDEPIDKA